MVTILTEIYNIDPVEGTEYLTYNVSVAQDLDDWSPKYSYNCSSRETAQRLAEKIHRDQHTEDLILNVA